MAHQCSRSLQYKPSGFLPLLQASIKADTLASRAGFSSDGGLTMCSAVDNLLLKLAAEGVPFLRIGRLSQVDQGLHAWMPGGSHHPDTSVHGLRATAQAARVVIPSLSVSPLQYSKPMWPTCDALAQLTPFCMGNSAAA